MQVDDIAHQHDDLDTDSLFGSPPPSPGRGRSPFSLALPNGLHNTQNVGTLALPGSHLCSELSELPSAPNTPPSVPVKRSVTNWSKPHVQPSRSVSATPPIPTSAPRSTTATLKKVKRASRRSTSAIDMRPTPPPITLPSPTDPPPANFLRNQQALLGLAGLVGGVNPANLSVQRHTRGESPNNPIVVEEVPDTPKIGRWPVHHPGIVPGQLPVPSTQEVLSTLVKQKNLYPVVDALLRLVSNAAGVAHAVPLVYPAMAPPSTPVAGSSHATPYAPAYQYSYHPYQYAYPYHYAYPYSYSNPYPHPNFQFTTAASPSPAKKRKLTDVPAGAADWDVPYPFAAGQGPPGYHSNWGRQRQQQLLEDLVGLVKSASQKAAAKKAKDEVSKQAAIGSVEYYRGRVLQYCRPQLIVPGQADSHIQPATVAVVPQSTQEPTSLGGLSASSSTLGTAETQGEPSLSGRPLADIQHDNPAPESQLAAEAATIDDASSSPSLIAPSGAADGASELDELLALFNDIPAGDLDALLAASDLSAAPVAAEDGTTSSMPLNDKPSDPSDVHDNSLTASPSDVPAIDPLLFATDPSLLAIDPALLAISFPLTIATSGSQIADISSRMSPSSALSTATSVEPPTPTLAGSPASLSELDPPTPNWDFSFPEPEIAVSDSESTIGESRRTDNVTGAERGESMIPRQDKGKGRAREEDFAMDADTDTSAAPSVAGDEASPLEQACAQSMHSTTPPPTRGDNVAWEMTRNTSAIPPFQFPVPFAQPPFLPPFVQRSSASTPLAKSGLTGRTVPSTSQGKNREDIIRRARAMRAQIVEEIKRAKVELWETTMEGGCLAVLAKERDKLA